MFPSRARWGTQGISLRMAMAPLMKWVGPHHPVTNGWFIRWGTWFLRIQYHMKPADIVLTWHSRHRIYGFPAEPGGNPRPFIRTRGGQCQTLVLPRSFTLGSGQHRLHVGTVYTSEPSTCPSCCSQTNTSALDYRVSNVSTRRNLLQMRQVGHLGPFAVRTEIDRHHCEVHRDFGVLQTLY